MKAAPGDANNTAERLHKRQLRGVGAYVLFISSNGGQLRRSNFATVPNTARPRVHAIHWTARLSHRVDPGVAYVALQTAGRARVNEHQPAPALISCMKPEGSR